MGLSLDSVRFFSFHEKGLLFVPKMVYYNLSIWRRIEVVITALTRNQVVLTGSWVRIPPSPFAKSCTDLFLCMTFLFAQKNCIRVYVQQVSYTAFVFALKNHHK